MALNNHKQPPWVPPLAQPNNQLAPLKIYNSLTRTKDDFIPVDPTGKKVTWYSCGPTVYEDAHLGHAKNYVSIDIIRRIMKDYFGFDIQFVMNTTDIDDKIILKSRQQYLLTRFKHEHATKDDSVSNRALSETNSAFRHYITKNLPALSSDVTPESLTEEVDKTYKRQVQVPSLDNAATAEQSQDATVERLLLRARIQTARAAAEALVAPGKLSEFLTKTEEILLPYLDASHGAEVDFNDHQIYLNVSQKFEQRFFEDMNALNVLPPDQLTRVTEYVPQVVRFAEKIVANGFGYATPDGSVYFDIDSFEKAGHSYARLEPWNKTNHALQDDGEGSLSQNRSMKRGKGDFALWKASKPGEPAWPSPWGRGRPGWHIECSAMASEVIGNTIDIHSGGADLRFPHHDNELAQSEAYWSAPGCRVQWTNYFIHMGQLRIRGLKMSKSLKNFTTIRTVLSGDEWNARSLRICFLMMPWQDGIEVTAELMKAVVGWEGKLNSFFLRSLDIWSNHDPTVTTERKPGTVDQQLLSALEQAKADVQTALCDSFNTSAVMRILSDLVTECNSAEALSDETIILLAQWITRIVTIFGLDSEGDLNDPHRIGWSGLDIPALAKPYIYPLSHLRDSIRNIALSGSVDHAAITQLADGVTVAASTPVVEAAKSYKQVLQQFCGDIQILAAEQSTAKDFLTLCDQLRDVHLWDLGIYLEDRNNSKPALVRPLDTLLIEARVERESASIAKAQAKQEKEAKAAESLKELQERAKVDPALMFRASDEYSEWDGNGIPTVDAAGKAVSKNRHKKLVKEWEKQKERYEQWVAATDHVS